MSSKFTKFPMVTKEGDYDSTNFIWKIRLFIVRLFMGKKSIVGNCKLVNVMAICNHDSFIYNCDFVQGKKSVVKDRILGITLRIRGTK